MRLAENLCLELKLEKLFGRHCERLIYAANVNIINYPSICHWVNILCKLTVASLRIFCTTVAPSSSLDLPSRSHLNKKKVKSENYTIVTVVICL